MELLLACTFANLGSSIRISISNRYASDRFGGKPVMSMSLLATGVCTAALVPAAHFGSVGICVVLFIEGAVQGPTFPTNAVTRG